MWGDSRWANNDGIDVDSCQNVTISDSVIDVADDGVSISVESAPAGPRLVSVVWGVLGAIEVWLS